MAEIAALTAGSTPDGTEKVHALQGSNSRRFTFAQILAIIHAHTIANVTGLQAALDAKIDDSQAGAGGLAVLGAASAGAALTALGISAFAQTILDDADAATVRATIGAGVGGGDASGPASSVDNHVAIFNSTTGKLLKDGGVAILANGCTITPQATPATTEVGYLGAPQQLGLDSGNVTLALTDCGKSVDHTDANARDLTIPANASVAFPIGTIICGSNEGSGIVTMKITSDTLRWGSSTGQRAIAQHGSWTIRKVTSTVWRLTGDGIT